MPLPLAYCGLECETCPIHKATIEPDAVLRTEMRAGIARKISELYGNELQAAAITDCDGCHAETGRLFFMCSSCEIRKCARALALDTCAACRDYACEKLLKMFVSDPDAQTRLEAQRTSFRP